MTTSYRPYLDTSEFNKPIPANAPIHPDSPKMISQANYWLLGGTSRDSQKEWLGPAGAKSTARTCYTREDTSKLQKITMYANANGWVGAGPFKMPMPSWAASVIGPWCQSGDSNVSIVDSITGDVWECWHCTPPGYTPRNGGFPANRWNCSSYRYWPASTLKSNGYAPPSKSYQPGTSATKIQLTCGLLVPEDFADCLSGKDPGTIIPHALRMSNFCGASGGVATHPTHVAPAFSGDGRQPYGIPAGARAVFDPKNTVDVNRWPTINVLREPWRTGMKKLLRTLRENGIIQVDSFPAAGGGCIDAASSSSVIHGGDGYPVGYKWVWDIAGYPWGKNGIPYDLMSKFYILDWR